MMRLLQAVGQCLSTGTGCLTAEMNSVVDMLIVTTIVLYVISLVATNWGN